MWKVSKYRAVLLWQVVFILVSLSWLYAPWLNPTISAKFSMISHYEDVQQPFSWLFRSFDLIGGMLLLLAALQLYRHRIEKWQLWLFTIGAAGMLLDPVFPTNCQPVHLICHETVTNVMVIHTVETFITSAAIFLLSVLDILRRRKIVSVLFLVSQTIYIAYFFLNSPAQASFNTALQFMYQFAVVLWLAWYVRDHLIGHMLPMNTTRARRYRATFAIVSFGVGILSILVSVVHLRYLAPLDHLYDFRSGWIAQHGVIFGLVMLYLSRHLLRGELRARQILLALLGVETIRFAIISPEETLLTAYLVFFTTLFVLRDAFDRGATELTRDIRLKDLGVFISGILLSTILVVDALVYERSTWTIVTTAFDHFTDIMMNSHVVRRIPHGSVLLAHGISALGVGAIIGVLWVLFRPNVRTKSTTNLERERARRFLLVHSTSTEDYFKYWPRDKQYFFSEGDDGFVAFRRSGVVAFALADPIGHEPVEILNDFMRYCRMSRLKACFIPVMEASLELYKQAGLQTINIGASALIDIATFAATTSKDKWWRWQRNRAEKSGYGYAVSQPPHDPRFVAKIQTVSDAWLKTGGHTERGFALGYFDRDYINHCAVHYLVDDAGQIIAFVNIVPQWGDLGTVTIDLLRYLPAYNGAMPYLLYRTISSYSENDKYRTFDLGFVPFAAANSPVIRLAKILGGKRFSSSGLEQFKNKFDPVWVSAYLAYDGDAADLTTIGLRLERVMKPLGHHTYK